MFSRSLDKNVEGGFEEGGGGERGDRLPPGSQEG